MSNSSEIYLHNTIDPVDVDCADKHTQHDSEHKTNHDHELKSNSKILTALNDVLYNLQKEFGKDKVNQILLTVTKELNDKTALTSNKKRKIDEVESDTKENNKSNDQNEFDLTAHSLDSIYPTVHKCFVDIHTFKTDLNECKTMQEFELFWTDYKQYYQLTWQCLEGIIIEKLELFYKSEKQAFKTFNHNPGERFDNFDAYLKKHIPELCNRKSASIKKRFSILYSEYPNIIKLPFSFKQISYWMTKKKLQNQLKEFQESNSKNWGD